MLLCLSVRHCSRQELTERQTKNTKTHKISRVWRYFFLDAVRHSSCRIFPFSHPSAAMATWSQQTPFCCHISWWKSVSVSVSVYPCARLSLSLAMSSSVQPALRRFGLYVSACLSLSGPVSVPDFDSDSDSVSVPISVPGHGHLFRCSCSCCLSLVNSDYFVI